MASVPGTSGSSGGRNQPPNKRTKMDTGNSSNPDSDQDQNSLHSDQPGSVSSMTRAQPDYLKCAVCQEYPRMQVYQCVLGHIVCDECEIEITRCPQCRKDYGAEKNRNRVAETALDGMSFNCIFRDSGCLRTNIRRNQRTAHEIQCDHNPSPSSFKCCGLFDGLTACKFRIDPNSIIQDPQHTKDLIEHMTIRPHNLIYDKIKIGEKSGFIFSLSCNSLPFKPCVLFEVYNGTTGKTIGYYVLIRRASVLVPKKFSWAIVGLNSAPVNPNGRNRHSEKITVLFSMKAKTDPNKVVKDGDGCVPDQNWPLKSMYLDEWMEFLMAPIQDRPPFSFSLPFNFLEEYYEQEDGKYQMYVSFGP